MTHKRVGPREIEIRSRLLLKMASWYWARLHLSRREENTSGASRKQLHNKPKQVLDVGM